MKGRSGGKGEEMADENGQGVADRLQIWKGSQGKEAGKRNMAKRRGRCGGMKGGSEHERGRCTETFTSRRV